MARSGSSRRSAGDTVRRLAVLSGLAVAVAAVYAGVVLGGSLLLGRPAAPDPLLSILATAVVALTLEPASDWLRRRTSGTGAARVVPPDEVLRSFSRSSAASWPTEELPARIAEGVARATAAPTVEVWLHLRDRLVLAAREPTGPGPLEPGRVRSYDVCSAGEVLAVLRLRLDAGTALAPTEERLLAGLAAQAGLALRGARLRTELLERARELALRADELRDSRRRLVAAQDDERRHLERDIHDGAQQHLVALAVNLRLAQALAGRAPDRAADLLLAQAQAARRAVETVLDLSRGIYPPVLRDRGVVAALQSASAGSSVPVRIEAREVRRYPPEIEAAVYFACLEALQNAVKHAAARSIAVRVLEERGELVVTVDDDGRGLDPVGSGPGAGLGNMRDRVDAVGGRLRLAAAPAGGLRVAVRVPVPRPAEV